MLNLRLVTVKRLNLHILEKNTDIFSCNRCIEYSLKHGKFKSNLEINFLCMFAKQMVTQSSLL